VRFAVASATLLFLWAHPAAADLYRWVDPETGSVKFSSYPPSWFGGAAPQRRGPKVEHIPAGRPAPAIEPREPDLQDPSKPPPEASGKVQAPANSSTEERRKALLQQISAQVAKLPGARPEDGARIYADLAEQVREYNSAELFLRQVDSGGEAARRMEWNGVVAALDGRRRRLQEQVLALPVPAEGSSPEEIRVTRLELGLQLAALGWMDKALKLFDPRDANPRRPAQ